MHDPDHGFRGIRASLPTAAAIGGIVIGLATAMAAAGLCAALGGNAQIENAAEIALEHHQGMTCDQRRAWCRCPASSGAGSEKVVAAASP